MWGCGILCAAWTVCDQVSLSHQLLLPSHHSKRQGSFSIGRWFQDIEKKERVREREEGKSHPLTRWLPSARDESWSIRALHLCLSLVLGGFLTNSGWSAEKALSAWGFQEDFPHWQGTVYRKRNPLFLYPFPFACDPILWDRKPEHTVAILLHPWPGVFCPVLGWQVERQFAWFFSDGDIFNWPWVFCIQN